MEKKQKRTVSIRMDVDILEKLHEIAREEGRTVNGQVYYWLRRALWAYEEEKTGNKKKLSVGES